MRFNKLFDFGRLSNAVSRPGIDPRTWCDTALASDSQYSFSPLLDFSTADDESIGRVATTDGTIIPYSADEEIVVVFPSGSADSNPIVLGKLFGAQKPLPTAVHSLVLNPLLPASDNIAQVSFFDTEVKVSSYARREQYEKGYYLHAKSINLLGESIYLASNSDAILSQSEPILKGESLVAELVSIVDELLKALKTASPPISGLATFELQWLVQKETIGEKVLSKKVFTE